MTETTPQQNNTVSPDGLWAWDGTEWKPNTATAGTAVPTPVTPKKKSRKGLKIAGGTLAALIAVAGISGAMGGSDSGSSSTDTTASTSTTKGDEKAESKSDEVSTPGLGDAVRDGKFEFTVTDVDSGVSKVGDEYLNEKAQGSFTVLTMTVENIGDEAQMFDASNVEAVDSQGRELSADSTASYYATGGSESFLEDINPGNSVTVKVVFDVAKGESVDQVVVHDSAFSDGATIQL